MSKSYNMVCPRPNSCDAPGAFMSITPNLCCEETKNRGTYTRLTECKSLSHVQLCDPVDWGPPGSSVHGILQARILEWVANLLSRESSQPRDQTGVSCIAGRFFTGWATREAHVWLTAGLSVLNLNATPSRKYSLIHSPKTGLVAPPMLHNTLYSPLWWFSPHCIIISCLLNFFKSSSNLLHIPSVFYGFFFLAEACGILASWPGIKPTPPALEGEILTIGLPGKSPSVYFSFSTCLIWAPQG